MERTILSSVAIHGGRRLGKLLCPAIQHAKGQCARNSPEDRFLRSLYRISVYYFGPDRHLARRAAWNTLELTTCCCYADYWWSPRHTLLVC